MDSFLVFFSDLAPVGNRPKIDHFEQRETGKKLHDTALLSILTKNGFQLSS